MYLGKKCEQKIKIIFISMNPVWYVSSFSCIYPFTIVYLRHSRFSYIRDFHTCDFLHISEPSFVETSQFEHIHISRWILEFMQISRLTLFFFLGCAMHMQMYIWWSVHVEKCQWPASNVQSCSLNFDQHIVWTEYDVNLIASQSPSKS